MLSFNVYQAGGRIAAIIAKNFDLTSASKVPDTVCRNVKQFLADLTNKNKPTEEIHPSLFVPKPPNAAIANNSHLSNPYSRSLAKFSEPNGPSEARSVGRGLSSRALGGPWSCDIVPALALQLLKGSTCLIA